MKVFVTGGNGFIGSRVIRSLVEHGHSAVCLLRKTSDTKRLSGCEFERQLGDVRDRESVRNGMSGCDAVIHLASLSAWGEVDSPVGKEIIVEGTQNILDVAKELGNLRVVHVSSLTACGGSQTGELADESQSWTDAAVRDLPYASFKLEAERRCAAAAAAGQDVVVVIPAETYGPNDDQLLTARNLVDFVKSNPVLVCNGGASIAHVDDVALGTVRALDRGKAGQRYILGGANVTLRELARLTLECAGNRKKRIVTVPNSVLRTVTRVATKLSIPLPYDKSVVPYATRFWYASNAKASRELGVSFRSAKETLAPTVAWLKEAGHL